MLVHGRAGPRVRRRPRAVARRPRPRRRPRRPRRRAARRRAGPCGRPPARGIDPRERAAQRVDGPQRAGAEREVADARADVDRPHHEPRARAHVPDGAVGRARSPDAGRRRRRATPTEDGGHAVARGDPVGARSTWAIPPSIPRTQTPASPAATARACSPRIVATIRSVRGSMRDDGVVGRDRPDRVRLDGDAVVGELGGRAAGARQADAAPHGPRRGVDAGERGRDGPGGLGPAHRAAARDPQGARARGEVDRRRARWRRSPPRRARPRARSSGRRRRSPRPRPRRRRPPRACGRRRPSGARRRCAGRPGRAPRRGRRARRAAPRRRRRRARRPRPRRPRARPRRRRPRRAPAGGASGAAAFPRAAVPAAPPGTGSGASARISA